MTEEDRGWPYARFATPAEAEAATGFKPGCIPPLLLPGAPTKFVLMDERVLLLPSVYAGAGKSGEHLHIAPAELRRAANAMVGKLVDDAPRELPGIASPIELSDSPTEPCRSACAPAPMTAGSVSLPEALRAVDPAIGTSGYANGPKESLHKKVPTAVWNKRARAASELLCCVTSHAQSMRQ